MIDSIHIKNVASYGETGGEIQNLKKMNFFFGANGTGKSTIARHLYNFALNEDEKDNNEYVRHTGDNLNDYLFEVNGLGMLSLNDCTVNGINAIKLGLAYPDESFERNNSLLGFQKTNITVSDYVIYDDSNPCISRKSGYEMFVGDTEKNEVDCIFKSTNGTAFYLKYLNQLKLF